jgi:hypothetical protein
MESSSYLYISRDLSAFCLDEIFWTCCILRAKQSEDLVLVVALGNYIGFPCVGKIERCEISYVQTT